MIRRFLLLALLSLAVVAPAVHAITYDPSADFSFVSNPNGAWRYGWSSGLTGAFNLYTNRFGSSSTVEFWNTSGVTFPFVANNPHPFDYTVNGVTIPAGYVALHPNSNAIYSHILWTAPTSGAFMLNAEYLDISPQTATTDVHIRRNGVSVFSSTINGSNPSRFFSAPISITSGDVFDFAVGPGGVNGEGDTTALRASIATIVPEMPPALLIELALPMIGAVIATKFRRQ